MFGPVGGRPQTTQQIALGATRSGVLTHVRHDVMSHTSEFEDFVEPSALITQMLYACPNGMTTHRLVKLHIGTPTFQRAPGEATGRFALEVAMDELAYALKLDPVELRLRNYAERKPTAASRSRASSCGSATRRPQTASAGRGGRRQQALDAQGQRDGRLGHGHGHLSGASDGGVGARTPAAGRTVLVQSGSQDIGTGTYTVMTQVAARNAGRTRQPRALRARRHGAAAGARVRWLDDGGKRGSRRAGGLPEVARAADRAGGDRSSSPLHGLPRETRDVDGGWLIALDESRRREGLAALAGRMGTPIEAAAEAKPGDEDKRFAAHSFGAVFVEVRVDRDLARFACRASSLRTTSAAG